MAAVQSFERGGFLVVFLVDPVLELLLVLGVLVGELTDEVDVNVALLPVVEVLVGDGEVDARLDGDVEGADAVRGEDEDAVIVFEDTEKDYVHQCS